MGLLGGFQRTFYRDRSITLNFALLLNFDVGTCGRTNRVDVASGASNHSRNRVNRNLNLFTFHRSRLTLLNRTLAHHFFPAFLAFHHSYAVVLQNSVSDACLSNGLLSWTGRFRLLLLAMIIHSFVARMTLFLTAVGAVIAAVKSS